MSKQNKEQKLAKIVSGRPPIEDAFALIMPPKLFGLMEAALKRHLESQRFDDRSRGLIIELAFAWRQEAFARFGHDSVETIELGRLLKAAQNNQTVWRPKPGRLDCISHIQGYANRNSRLDTTEQSAAEMIKVVWEAFGRFRLIGGRSMEAGLKGGAGLVLQPLDVMGDETYQHYRTVYCPWYEEARKAVIPRLRANGVISVAAIVFKALVEDFHPEEIDASYGLVKSTALRTLKDALSCYWGPEALKAKIEGREPRHSAPAPAVANAA